jgi:protein subunit release factor B
LSLRYNRCDNAVRIRFRNRIIQCLISREVEQIATEKATAALVNPKSIAVHANDNARAAASEIAITDSSKATTAVHIAHTVRTNRKLRSVVRERGAALPADRPERRGRGRDAV